MEGAGVRKYGFPGEARPATLHVSNRDDGPRTSLPDVVPNRAQKIRVHGHGSVGPARRFRAVWLAWLERHDSPTCRGPWPGRVRGLVRPFRHQHGPAHFDQDIYIFSFDEHLLGPTQVRNRRRLDPPAAVHSPSYTSSGRAKLAHELQLLLVADSTPRPPSHRSSPWAV